MRICLISNRLNMLDEGMSNVAFHLEKQLSLRHTVLGLKVSATSSVAPVWWRTIKQFRPDIVHYIPGPSLKSFVLTKLVKLSHRQVKVVMSATRPSLGWMGSPLIRLLRPDMVLVQSGETESVLRRAGCTTEFLPNGVDVARFVPRTYSEKRALRSQYGLAAEASIVLHVGPVKNNRNTRILAEVQSQTKAQVLVVGSLTNAAEESAVRALKTSGCIVWRRFLERIEEVYALSDCYVFPTTDHRAAVETPLSVLEAMACNLPVITTRFGALPRLFQEGEGLRLVQSPSEIAELVRMEARDRQQVRTRQKVLPYSWDLVAEQLENIYAGVLQS